MIAIIDCAIQRPSIHCFNEIIHRNPLPFTYHHPPSVDPTYLKDTNYNGYIIFGSYSNVSDKLPWQKILANSMKEKILKGKFVAGICFGHQLMADAFGGTVGPIKKKYSGSRNISIISNYGPFKKDEHYSVIVQHGQEVKTISNDFIHIGTSNECKYDILAHKNLPYISFQGHPEASKDFITNSLELNTPFPDNINKSISDGIKIIDQIICMINSSLRRLAQKS